MPKEEVKVATTLSFRADPDVIEWFRNRADECGVKYQTLLKRALYEYQLLHGDRHSLEQRLREIVREEMHEAFGFFSQAKLAKK